MKETRFRWLLRCVLVGYGPMAVVMFGAACGGSSTGDGRNATSGSGGTDGGGAGGLTSAGASGTAAGLNAGGGSSAGQGGSGASAGQGGSASAGSGGAVGGSGGGGGSAGLGSAGTPAVCHAPPPQLCGGGPITLPRACVSEAMATVGTVLPTNTCQTMCETMFSFSCTISAVDTASITVKCMTGCPATQ